MTIPVEIPDDLAERIASAGQSPARAALEALALEEYRQRRLSESGVRRLLGFESRFEVHEFLQEHDVDLNYGIEELEHDIRETDRMIALLAAQEPVEHRAG